MTLDEFFQRHAAFAVTANLGLARVMSIRTPARRSEHIESINEALKLLTLAHSELQEIKGDLNVTRSDVTDRRTRWIEFAWGEIIKRETHIDAVRAIVADMRQYFS